MLHEFQQYIKKENLFQQKDKLLLAVSGGVDSVVLCELCKQADYDFAIAHCNFQLRESESDRDEQFVRRLGEKYGMQIWVKQFDTLKYAAEKKISIQVAARELRYHWFHSLVNPATNQPFSHILTAHHANDNIETLLMNFFKGTGINGLQGILPKQGKIRRPLLLAKKEKLVSFAEENKLSFVEDSSNISDKYTRNYFRNRLIPALQTIFPQVEDNLLNNLQRFREIDMLYHQSIEIQKKKLLEQKGYEVHIPVLKLLKTDPLPTILYEVLSNFGFTPHQTEAVIALLQSDSGKYIQSATHRIIKNRNWLIISPNQTKQAQHILIEENDTQIEFDGGLLEIEKIKNSKFKIQNNPALAQLNAVDIKFPLLLRKWKQGDYFYPLGMKKKKKLSRFFIDQKLSLTQKENIWVIEMDKKIIWVLGMRIDDRFKVTDKAKNILVIKLQ